MSTSGASIAPIEHQHLALRARPDLVYQQQTYHGQTWWLVKDPLTLKYFRFPEQACAALRLLDGRTTLHEIKTEIEERFPPAKITYQELHSLLGMLHQSGLVLAEAAGQGEELFKRKQKQVRKRVIQQASSVMWIRVPGVDPERFLNWLYPKVHWFFSRWFILVWAMLAASAVLLVLVHLNEFYSRLPGFHEFFSAGNFIWMMVALGFAKILHELGHGLACKHFGGECHEIGVMFLVFTPCLYCDTSDSWILPNKWHRAAIGAAGMYVEVFLASICTFVWWNTEPGLLHYVCLNIMFVSSLSAVMFNGNPLLRYDGYYILSDILEIPNLSQKSRQVLIESLRHWCLGLPWSKNEILPEKHRGLFVFYAVASLCYRWLVVIAILWFLAEVLEPYGLQPIAHMLIAMTLIGMIVVPIWNVAKYFRVPGRIAQVNRRRLLITGAFVSSVLIAICMLPFPHRVMTSVVIEPQDAERIYVNVPGVLDSLVVGEGKPVESDETIAVLKNPDIEVQLNRLQGERERMNQRLRALNRQSSRSGSAEQIPYTREALQSIDERLERLKENQRRLTLTSHTSGVIMPPPQAMNDLNSGSDSPLEEINREIWLRTGTLFCLVGDPARVNAVLVIDQSNIEFIREGQRVDISLDEYPTKTWSGVIEEVASIDLKVAPRNLSNKTGGALSTETDRQGTERLTRAAYQARVSLNNENDRLLPGFRGRAKVHVGSRTIGQAIARYLAQTGS